jgi:CubicO group peptidase (beta-lactamase class C family)
VKKQKSTPDIFSPAKKAMNQTSSLKLWAVLFALLLPTICFAQQENSELSARIAQIMQARASAGEFNGSVLVARRGRIVYERGFGLANREWNIPNDVHTKFEIGSMTKQFTALLILQFVNEGTIQLDRHLSDYLPYYRKDTGSRVTISELLSHTSGIPNFTSLLLQQVPQPISLIAAIDAGYTLVSEADLLASKSLQPHYLKPRKPRRAAEPNASSPRRRALP